MGKKKVFIDKKTATTYNLVFRGGGEGDENAEGRVGTLAPVSGPGAAQTEDYDDYSVYESEAGSVWHQYEDTSYELTEERRRELVGLGFPDDGYDYLAHTRDLGRGKPRQAEQTIEEDDLEGEEVEDDSDIDDDADADISSTGTGPSTSTAAAAAGGPLKTGITGISGLGRNGRPKKFQFHQEGAAVGPSVYIPATRRVAPTEDVKLVDARGLLVSKAGDNEEEADAAQATVTAFARQANPKKGRVLQDIAEVAQGMADLESNDPRRVQVVEGEEFADWLDDFVAGTAPEEEDGAPTSAAAGKAAAAGAAGAAGPSGRSELDLQTGSGSEDEADLDLGGVKDPPSSSGQQQQQQQQQKPGPGQHLAQRVADLDLGSADEDDDEDDEDQDGQRFQDAETGSRAGRPGARAESIASSYWRPERTDRKQGFAALDDKFEKLALEYEDEHLGELDEDEEVEAARNGTDISAFGGVLDEFLADQRANQAALEQGLVLQPVSHGQNRKESFETSDARVIAATKQRLSKVLEDAHGDEDHAFNDKQVVQLQESERWDCESVLSLRSNLDNHPAKIVEPQRRTGGRGGSTIKLSSKTGMPTGYGPTQAALRDATAAATSIPEEPEDEAAAAAAVVGQQGNGATASVSGSSEGDDEDEEGQEGLDPAMLIRPKNESTEDKKARKAAIKEAQRSQRAAKKQLKTMFRHEASAAQRQMAGRSGATRSTYVIP